MGEALISRAGGGGESEQIIPVTPGYHTTIVTLKDYENKAMPNYIINCRDGSSWYNYTTNDKGQAMFVCNSGSANFTVSNTVMGLSYIDFGTAYLNIDAPVGATSRHNIILNQISGRINITSSRWFGLLIAKNNISISVCGGGGGGSSGWSSGGDGGDADFWGANGGNANCVNTVFNFISNYNYYAQVGTGGYGGPSKWTGNYGRGGAGGASSFNKYLANGGSGGNPSGDDVKGGTTFMGVYGRGGRCGYGGRNGGLAGSGGVFSLVLP